MTARPSASSAERSSADRRVTWKTPVHADDGTREGASTTSIAVGSESSSAIGMWSDANRRCAALLAHPWFARPADRHAGCRISSWSRERDAAPARPARASTAEQRLLPREAAVAKVGLKGTGGAQAKDAGGSWGGAAPTAPTAVAHKPECWVGGQAMSNPFNHALADETAAAATSKKRPASKPTADLDAVPPPPTATHVDKAPRSAGGVGGGGGPNRRPPGRAPKGDNGEQMVWDSIDGKWCESDAAGEMPMVR